MNAADAFDALRAALERAGIRYAIGGSWASTAFGEPPFTIRRAPKTARKKRPAAH
jgi:hypothetical protein